MKKSKNLIICMIMLVMIIMCFSNNIAEAACPKKPELESIVPVSSTSVNLKWKSVSGAVEYRIDRRKDGTSKYSTIKTGITGTSYKDTGLESGTRYCYRVYAINREGTSEKPAGVWVRTLPDQPKLTKLYATGSDSVVLEWNSVKGANSYRIDRRKDGTGQYSTVKTGLTGTKYTDTGLESGTRYCYRVYAVTPEGYISAKPAGIWVKTNKKAEMIYLNDSMVELVLNKNGYTYDGTEKEPKVIVSNGTKELVSGTDYSVTYANNKDAGNATVVITGQGNYAGTVTKRFSIKKAEPVFTKKPVAKELYYNSSEQALLVNGKASGGTIKYSIDDKKYSEKIPTGKNVGTYTIYYKIIGDKNHFDSQKQKIKIEIKDVKNCILKQSEINRVAKQYDLNTTGNAYKALESINFVYSPKLTNSERTGNLVFLFEGVGSSADASKRMNAMVVVVKSNKVVYLNMNCSTIPDYPFSPKKNGGTAMPTLKSGIYNFTTKNHKGKYACLNILNAKVLRFNSKNSFYDSTSAAINVHRRSTNSIPSYNNTWVNSAGCQLIGKAGTSSQSEYSQFVKAIGIGGKSWYGDTKYSNIVKGKIIVDRSFASDYLKAVGYPKEAISKLMN